MSCEDFKKIKKKDNCNLQNEFRTYVENAILNNLITTDLYSYCKNTYCLESLNFLMNVLIYKGNTVVHNGKNISIWDLYNYTLNNSLEDLYKQQKELIVNELISQKINIKYDNMQYIIKNKDNDDSRHILFDVAYNEIIEMLLHNVITNAFCKNAFGKIKNRKRKCRNCRSNKRCKY